MIRRTQLGKIMSFSEQTRELLIQAGWTEDRWIDPGPYELLLKEKGFPVFPALSEFLARFGGLSFRNPAAVPPAAEDWHFRVKDALRHAFPNNIAAYSKIVGSPLSVIGEAFRGYLLLMMDARGRIFGGFDEVFLLMGTSGEDAIEALCSGRKLQPVSPEQPAS
jgi:SUKH-3 immunity protein